MRWHLWYTYIIIFIHKPLGILQGLHWTIIHSHVLLILIFHTLHNVLALKFSLRAITDKWIQQFHPFSTYIFIFLQKMHNWCSLKTCSRMLQDCTPASSLLAFFRWSSCHLEFFYNAPLKTSLMNHGPFPSGLILSLHQQKCGSASTKHFWTKCCIMQISKFNFWMSIH